MYRKLIYLLPLVIAFGSCGCGKEQKVDMAELKDSVTQLMNVRYEGYSAEKHDELIDTLLTPELADEFKEAVQDDENSLKISVADIMEQAEQDRYTDVLNEAYKREVGYTPKENVAVYDDEIYANYQAGKLDYLKNTEIDERIKQDDGGGYYIQLDEVRPDMSTYEVVLNVYGHEYPVELYGYKSNYLYKNNPVYKFKADGYALYNDGTFDIDFVTDTTETAETSGTGEVAETASYKVSGRVIDGKITELDGWDYR